MAHRPNLLDLRSQSHGPMGSGLPSPRSLPSPRLHIAGDVPPELSPLDAFAAQSRRLAKELERGMNGEKRMSRLPPLTIASSLGQGRPTYFRSASAEAASGTPISPTNSPGIGVKTEVEAPANRPISVYPVVSEAQPSLPPEPSPRFNLHDEEQFRGRSPASQPGGPGYFGVRREQSPPALGREQRPTRTEHSPSANIQPRPSAESMRQRLQQPRRLNDVSLGMGSYDSRALAPPRSPFAQRAPSPRSMSDSSDEDYNNSNPPYTLSPHRKLSSSSGLSTSPISPTMHPIRRSPSISSEISVGGTRLPRPAFNFSRPLSRASVNGIPAEVPSRQASSDSQPSFVLADDTAHTPVSMYSEGFPENNSESGAAPSYVYSRFSLPRGKMLQRNSLIFQEGLPQAQFSWEQPVPFSNVQAFHGGAPPSPPSRPSTSSLRPDPTRPSLDPGRPSYDPSRPSIDPARPSLDAVRSSTERGRATERSPASNNSAHSPSVSSSGTIKAKSPHSLAPSAEASGEENVAKAIEYHEAGALTKSTYHLRLAARQNHPTGMLLYALACRHGWGMRPNQREGVIWLRKAADFASLEIADDEDLLKGGKTVDVLEIKTRKAQFALSIYELGVSHMNGWGIEQDKALALRCFEIAGSWGDADALAEAGFCYAQAIGCKKDLKKSAKFYRQAESKGISMVGNSWIYKSKYNDSDDAKVSSESHGRPSLEKEKDKKPRNKSRSRTMFSRKKSAS
ncbi:Mitosis inhibitor nif1 [Lachnellula arida]|uniref:Mitosis inhibitor nif1 n=1 Tax=Lachnellula arida TaxID=1316785 RepID=A0A8T9BK33_9HELO|nr:Mitosis inhibitor nif1 [Lachnellula arida]